MTDFVKFPASILSAIEPRLQQLLMRYVLSREIPRCLLAFVGDHDVFDVRPLLNTDPDWDIFLGRLDQGLLGAALRSADMLTWPPNPAYRRGDSRTVYEIAKRIDFHGQPTAVLLIDYFKEDEHRRSEDYRVNRWSREIADVLVDSEREEAELRENIKAATQVCIDRTGALRGYAAIKRWNGKIRYFTAGDEEEKFVSLNQLEGICGEVLRTGRLLNVPAVKEHPSYLSSDDLIRSECVAPILIRGECVGVLNLESQYDAHFTPEFENTVEDFARTLAPMAENFRRPIGVEIGVHSRLLSDLVEQFSVPDDALEDLGDENHIRNWACDLCERKIRSLEGVTGARFIPVPEPRDAVPKDARKAVEDEDSYPHILRDGMEVYTFELLIKGVADARVEVEFSELPQRAALEIIDQFCRLTANEIRRRSSGVRGELFEQFVNTVRLVSAGGEMERKAFLADLPFMVRRMMYCDHVTLFKTSTVQWGDLPRLWVWQSTAETMGYLNPEELYYEASPEDGLTGFAASQRDVFIAKNLERKTIWQDTAATWKKKTAEQVETRYRSFFAVPLYDGDRLIGLFRGHRTAKRYNIPFTDADRDRLRLIQFLIEGLLSGRSSASAAPIAAA